MKNLKIQNQNEYFRNSKNLIVSKRLCNTIQYIEIQFVLMYLGTCIFIMSHDIKL